MNRKQILKTDLKIDHHDHCTENEKVQYQ